MRGMGGSTVTRVTGVTTITRVPTTPGVTEVGGVSRFTGVSTGQLDESLGTPLALPPTLTLTQTLIR